MKKIRCCPCVNLKFKDEKAELRKALKDFGDKWVLADEYFIIPEGKKKKEKLLDAMVKKLEAK